MKTFNNRRKVFNPNNRRSGPSRGSADSPYMPQQGNSNSGYRRNHKNFKDQHTDYLNKAKDAHSSIDKNLYYHRISYTTLNHYIHIPCFQVNQNQ